MENPLKCINIHSNSVIFNDCQLCNLVHSCLIIRKSQRICSFNFFFFLVWYTFRLPFLQGKLQRWVTWVLEVEKWHVGLFYAQGFLIGCKQSLIYEQGKAAQRLSALLWNSDYPES